MTDVINNSPSDFQLSLDACLRQIDVLAASMADAGAPPDAVVYALVYSASDIVAGFASRTQQSDVGMLESLTHIGNNMANRALHARAHYDTVNAVHRSDQPAEAASESEVAA